MRKVKFLSAVVVVVLCGAFAASQADVNSRVYVRDPMHSDVPVCPIGVNATLLPNGSFFTVTYATLDRNAECLDLYTFYTTI